MKIELLAGMLVLKPETRSEIAALTNAGVLLNGRQQTIPPGTCLLVDGKESRIELHLVQPSVVVRQA